MLKTSDRSSMSLEQAVGLAGANANAVNPHAVSYEVAQYLLSKSHRHLLNDSFAQLCGRVEKIVEWQKIFEIGFRIDVNLDRLEMIEPPRDPCRMVVLPPEEDLSIGSLYNVLNSIVSRIEIGGNAWHDWCENRQLCGKWADPAAFLRDEIHSNSEHYGLMPQCVWIYDRVEYSRSPDGAVSRYLKLEDAETSRCITLKEYLIYTLADRISWIRTHQSLEGWSPPLKNSRIWCLGSAGSVVKLDGSRGPRVPFSPLVYWAGNTMYIECQPLQGTIEGGTLYVVRPPC